MLLSNITQPQPQPNNNTQHYVPIPGSVYSVMYSAALSGLFGVITNAFCIFCIFYLGMNKKPISRIMIHVFISGLFFNIGMLYNWTHISSLATSGVGCNWQTFWGYFGNWCMGSWNSVVAIVLVRRVVFNKRLSFAFERVCILVIYPVSFISALLGFLIYPTTWASPVVMGSSCFISDQFSLTRVLVQHLFMSLCIICILLAYSFLAYYVHTNSVLTAEDKQNSSKAKTIRRLAIYPWIFLSIWLWAPVTRIAQLVQGTIPLAFLEFAISITPWLPFTNAVWFIYSREVIFSLKDKITQSSSSGEQKKDGSSPNPSS